MLAVLGALGCGGATQRRVVFEKTVPLPAGRFVGPIEIEVPRKVDDPFVVYEIHTKLRAACAPRLRVSYMDGEAKSLGAGDGRWQELLALRAEGETPEAAPPSAPEAAVTVAQEPAAAASVDSAEQAPVDPVPPADLAPAAPGQVETGRWNRTTTDTWQGQSEFLSLRQQHCAKVRTFTHQYDTALDETGRIAIWGDVPQELAGATLSIKIVEAVDMGARQEFEEERAKDGRDRTRKARKQQQANERRRRKRLRKQEQDRA